MFDQAFFEGILPTRLLLSLILILLRTRKTLHDFAIPGYGRKHSVAMTSR